MSMSMMYYLAGVLEGVGVGAIIILVVSTIWLFFSLLVNVTYGDKMHEEQAKLIKKICMVFAISLFISIIVPCKKDMLIMTGLAYAKESEIVAKGGDTAFKALNVINKELDKMLEEK